MERAHMKIRPIGANKTEATVNNITLLYSYETPVAGYDDQGAFRTDEKFSRTTSKHINQYLGGADVGRVIPQADIEGMVA
tara:strand:+ start:214 stop:453 length:240 start_codon:yes stop_codon:yes gene_type:complete